MLAFCGSNNCKTSIVDYYRSCPKCSYDLCLYCCREIRNGSLQAAKMAVKHFDRGKAYLHGGKPLPLPSGKKETKLISKKYMRLISEWKVGKNSDIPCPVKKLGGCGHECLELKCMFPDSWLLELQKKTEKLVKIHSLIDMPHSSTQCCSCFKLNGEIDTCNKKLRKAASREDFVDNYLYCPSSSDMQHEGLEHFRSHWIKGEPVIITDMFKFASGLSWEPMVMWRAVRDFSNSKGSSNFVVKAIDCLDCCEACFVSLFFKIFLFNDCYGHGYHC